MGGEITSTPVDAAAGTDTTLVTATAGKKIRVVGCSIAANGGAITEGIFQSGTAGTALWRFAVVLNDGGFVLPFNPHGWFETAAGVLLNLNLTGIGAIGKGGVLTVLV